MCKQGNKKWGVRLFCGFEDIRMRKALFICLRVYVDNHIVSGTSWP